MAKTLQEHFPIIRDREEVITEIYGNKQLLSEYESWTEEQQTLFLEYCTGIRGVKILYDQFFKLVINPEHHPERLEKILSVILSEPVKILQVLPNESTRIATEKSLLVLDIVVELQNGSIANVEVQRIGYAFPGQRSACYSADLLMRQYKRIKKVKKKKFRYSDIKKVYTIVFFEKSTAEFHKFPNTYVHRSKQQTDTGLQIDLLQEYIFISLDICKNHLQNNSISRNNKLEAWLTFLSVDDPKWISKLIEVHPEFKKLYSEIYEACQNTEVMMGLFSKELLELDQNTVDFMIDEMQDTIDAQAKQLDSQAKQILEQQIKLETKDARIAQLEKQLSESSEK